jgi:hypothetical protein
MSAKPALAVRCTRGWVAVYTRRLPPEIGERRRAEIESDLWEHLNDKTSNDRVAGQILGRWLRGVPADVWWRYHTLLAQRGVRERSRDMYHNVTSNWWPPLVALYAIAATASVAVPAIVSDHEQATPAVVMTAIAATAGVLMVAGLAVRRRHLVAGSWMIGVGAVPGLGSVLFPAGLAVLIGGVWTGNLAFREPAAGIALDQSLAEKQAHAVGTWWRWLIAAAVLAGAGFAVLAAEDYLGDRGSEQEPTVLGGVAWLLWSLSWLGAAVTAVVGAVFAVMQLAVRHRTRHA